MRSDRRRAAPPDECQSCQNSLRSCRRPRNVTRPNNPDAGFLHPCEEAAEFGSCCRERVAGDPGSKTRNTRVSGAGKKKRKTQCPEKSHRATELPLSFFIFPLVINPPIHHHHLRHLPTRARISAGALHARNVPIFHRYNICSSR